MPKSRKGLSIKEDLFIDAMVAYKGNQTEAAFQVYDTKSRRNAKMIGSTMMSKDRIREAVMQRMKAKGITFDYLIDKSKKMIDEGIKAKPSFSDARLMISDMFKLYNAYPDKTKVSLSYEKKDITTLTSKDATTQLKQRLTASTKLLEDLNS